MTAQSSDKITRKVQTDSRDHDEITSYSSGSDPIPLPSP
uniref:Uncharacterized protein n=1 Tax=Arundo donax TaxID=35708 RepID=A0A0A9EK86_ARUDO